MKKILLLLSLGAAITGVSQTPLNYTKINQRYDWLAGKFDSTFHIPFGATTGLKGGGYTGAGALFFNTTTKQFQAYDGTYFRRYMDSAYVSGSDLILRYGNVTQTLAGIGGGGSTDTTSLSVRIDGKESVIDAGQRHETVRARIEDFPSTSPHLMFELANGRLMMVFSRGSTSLDGVPAITRMYRTYSIDGGVTWTDDARIFTDEFEDTDSIGIGGTGIFKTPDGNIHLMVTRVNTPLFQTQFYQSTTTDEGLTWSTPVLKFTTGYDAGKTDVNFTASNGTQWRAFNIGNAQPSPEGTYSGRLLKSTDNGVTWVNTGLIFDSPDSYPLINPGVGTPLCVENSIFEAEGILYHICRDRRGVVTMWNSTDGLTGAAWTGPYSSGLAAPNSMTSMKYDSVNKLIIAVHNEVLENNYSNGVAARLRLVVSVAPPPNESGIPLNWETVHLIDEDGDADTTTGYHFSGHNILRYKDKLIVGYYAGDGGVYQGVFEYDYRQKIIPIESLIRTGKQVFGRIRIQGRKEWYNSAVYDMRLFELGLANLPAGLYSINNHRLNGITGFSPVVSIKTTGNTGLGLQTWIDAALLAEGYAFSEEYFSKNNIAPLPTGVVHPLKSLFVGTPDAPGIAAWQNYANGKMEIRNPQAGNFALTFGIDSTTGSYITPFYNKNFTLSAYGGTSIILKPDRTINFPFLAGTGTRITTLSSTGDFAPIVNGTDGQVIMLVSGTPAWADAGAASAITALTGDVTASGTGSVVATIANASVQIDDIDATGTASSTTYLRGDGSWSTPAGGGGSPGGSNTQVQYNASGSFAGDADMVFDGTTLTAGGLFSNARVFGRYGEFNEDASFNDAAVGLTVSVTTRAKLFNMIDNGSGGVGRMSLTRAGVLRVNGLEGSDTRLQIVTAAGDFSVLANGTDGQFLKLVSGTSAWTSFALADIPTTGTASATTWLSGTGAWSNPVAGSSGYVQFNNAGVFGADASLFWDNPNDRLSIGAGSSPRGLLSFPGSASDVMKIIFHGSGTLGAGFSTYSDGTGVEFVMGTNLQINGAGAFARLDETKASAGMIARASGRFDIMTGGTGADAVARAIFYNDGTVAIAGLGTTGNRLVGRNSSSVLYETSLDPANISVSGHTHAFADLTSKPTTLSGYGITDATPSARTLTINGTAFDLTANRSWTIYGNLLLSTVVEDADYTALTTDYLIVYTSLTAPRTVTLPTAASMSGKTYIIKDEVGSAGTQTITLDGNASETIDGATTKTITAAYGFLRIYSNGSAWYTQ